ncbi:glycosyltransferase [Patescibacteria group bacterium]
MTQLKPKVSIIIVHYQNQKVLFNCLASIKKTGSKIKYEVIVVDNDEQKTIKQELKKKFPQTKYIASAGNLGYAAGNNLGAKQAKAKYLFILNPDTKILKNSIDELVKFLDKNKKTAVVAPLLVNARKKPYPLQGTSKLTPLKAIFSMSFISRLFPNNPIAKTYWVKGQQIKQPISVDVVPGSAFMIRKSVFKKLKGFDENFFLYFEESDLCQRLKTKGYQLYILPQGKVIHYWASCTSQSDKIKHIFNQSRFYFFKKHYSLLSAFVVEFFTRISLEVLALIFILGLATWLRFYRLPELMTFIGDQGRDYLAARNMVLTNKWPLVGIPSSVPWLKQGVLFIWMIALSFKLGGFHPMTPAIMTSTLGVLTVYLTYKLFSSKLSKLTSLIATLITATSPLMVIHSRMAYHISPIPLFSLLYLFSLIKLKDKKINIFWPAFLWSILFQFELVTAPLILLIPIIFYLNKIKPNKKHIFSFLSAITIPMLPKIIYDLTHGFKQTLGFIAWLGYRFLSFFGFKGQHTVSLNSLKQVTLTTFNHWQKLVIHNSPQIALLITLFIVFAIAHKLIKTKKLKPYFIVVLIYEAVIMLSFYFHQAPSEAYFPVLFPIWILSIAWAIEQFPKKLIYLFFLLLAFYNAQYLYKNNFLGYGPTLTQRLEVTKFIKQKTHQQSFKLKNYPTFVQYPSHLDNYRYLLWWLDSPEDPQAEQSFSIYQDNPQDFKFLPSTTTYHFKKIKLIKHD